KTHFHLSPLPPGLLSMEGDVTGGTTICGFGASGTGPDLRTDVEMFSAVDCWGLRLFLTLSSASVKSSSNPRSSTQPLWEAICRPPLIGVEYDAFLQSWRAL